MSYDEVKRRLEDCFRRAYEGSADEDEKYIYDNLGKQENISAFCEVAYTLGLIR